MGLGLTPTCPWCSFWLLHGWCPRCGYPGAAVSFLSTPWARKVQAERRDQLRARLAAEKAAEKKRARRKAARRKAARKRPARRKLAAKAEIAEEGSDG